MPKISRLIACVLASISFTAIAAAPRERALFNADWRFHSGDAPGAGDTLSYQKIKGWLLPSANDFASAQAKHPEGPAPGEDVAFAQPSFDDSSWRALRLPHDWGIEGKFDQALPGETGKLPWFGVGWYRKTFTLGAEDRDRRIYLEIDGAMAYSVVWCNGKFVGGWPYGYASYRLDLTPYVKAGAKNTLAIRLDNPHDSSRWYPGGGIYRDVWLLKIPQVHVEPWGVHVTTPQITAASATVEVRATVANHTSTQPKLVVKTEIYELDASGRRAAKPIAVASTAATVAGARETVSQKLAVRNPKLWSIEAPNRHVAILTLQQDGKTVDSQETIFGIRTAVFTANDGFHLNGKRVPLNGVCQHHDLGALGTAFYTRAADRQLEILKEMGVNALRTSHNPPSPALLDLCDRMGIVVMDEFVDTWRSRKTRNDYHLLFPDWAEADTRSFTRRDRNHPSVILWSIGNEIREQGQPDGPDVARKLASYVHQEDATRPITVGANNPNSGFNGFQKAVEAFGFNYKPQLYKRFHETNPEQPFYSSESASTVSSRGEYLFPVGNDKSGGKIGFQMSSYDLYAPRWATTPDDEFKGQDENPASAGEFVWTGFDYLGEPTPFNSDVTNLLNYHSDAERQRAEQELKAIGKIRVPSRSSYFGIVDLAGFKKDRFYIYQARWRPELPMAHILPHWNWPERVGQVTPVHVYTSGDEVELFLNGKSLGRKKKAQYEYRLRWDDVTYEPGKLEAVAYKNGKKWASDLVQTTGEAAKLILTADRTGIRADGSDLSFITATVADAEGRLVPRSNPKLTFTISGPGEIIATDNGDPIDHTSFQSPERAAFNGLALAIVKAKPGAAGQITVRAIAPGLAAAEIRVMAR